MEHLIELPQHILIGDGVLSRVPALCKAVDPHVREALVLSGPHTKAVAGDVVARALAEKGFVVREAQVTELSSATVKALEEAHKGVDIVIAAGGGRVIDAGKLFAFNRALPFVSIPTAPSHDGIASERARLTDGGPPYTVRAKTPNVIVADIKLLCSAPHRLVAAGFGDVISNYTAYLDWELGKKRGEYFGDYAANLALLSSQVAAALAEEIAQRSPKGVRALMDALISSSIAMSVAGSSRPASGSEHLVAHVLEGRESKALHGELVGVASILMAKWHGGDWEMVRDALRRAGAPVTAKALGETKERLVSALVEAAGLRKDRWTILHEKPLDRAAAERLCAETGVC